MATDDSRKKQYIRILLLDFSRAFDHIEHEILLQKWSQSDIPEFIINWKHDFLCERTQRVKIRDHVSSWKSPAGGTPQGTKSGGKDFKQMVKDMSAPLPLYKYVDDSTLFEICVRGAPSDTLQRSADGIANWCSTNKMLINAKKTKELVICFAHEAPDANRLVINGEEIERVSITKLLGVTISDDLTWETHINIISRKASQRLFFLRLLARCKVPMDKMISIYCTIIRPVVEYACQLWHGGLTGGQSDLIESIQKRAMRIIMPEANYELALQIAELPTLEQRRRKLCRKLFTEMQNESHKLHHMLPPIKVDNSVRAGKKYPLPKIKLERTKKSFVNWCLFNLQ